MVVHHLRDGGAAAHLRRRRPLLLLLRLLHDRQEQEEAEGPGTKFQSCFYISVGLCKFRSKLNKVQVRSNKSFLKGNLVPKKWHFYTALHFSSCKDVACGFEKMARVCLFNSPCIELAPFRSSTRPPCSRRTASPCSPPPTSRRCRRRRGISIRGSRGSSSSKGSLVFPRTACRRRIKCTTRMRSTDYSFLRVMLIHCIP